MSAFAESLETDWNNQGISKAQFVRVSSEDIANGAGQLTGHTTNTFDSGSLFKILQLLCIDDGAFIFNSRDELIQGVNMIIAHFKKVGMEMYIGIDGKKSKTECIFFLPTGYFKQ